MKVETPFPTIELSSLNNGDVFTIGSHVYMMIEHDKEKPDPTYEGILSPDCQCWDFQIKGIRSMYSDTTVIPWPNATLKLQGDCND